MNLQYGKIITSDSFFNGKPTNRQVAYSIPVIVTDKSQLLGEIIKAIDLISKKQTHTLKLTVHAGKDFGLKMLTKEYVVELDKNSTVTV